MDETHCTRDIILDRALALFSDRGYDAVGVQEIVEAAGITKPSLYHFFGSKRGLLDAIIEERGGRLAGAVALAAEYRRDLVLSLEKVAFALVRCSREDEAFLRFYLALARAPRASEAHDAAKGLNARLRAALEELFRKSEADHGNMRGRSWAYAATFLATVEAWISLALEGESKLSDAEIRAMLHRYEHGIFS